jgi:hypothetical protein
MPEPPSTFRDFGIIPDDLPPPAETVRSCLSGVGLFGQYLTTGLVAAAGLGLTVLFAFAMPLSMSLLACPAALAGFGVFIYLATRNDYGWIELQGNTLRAKHLYTGRTVERAIGEIENLTTIVNLVRRLETVIQEKLLGRVRGIDIYLRGQQLPLRVMRTSPAMTNAKELIEAIVYRMQQSGEIDYEIVDFAGKPLLRKIFWKGQPQVAKAKGSPNVVLGCLMALALMFGTILAFLGREQRELRTLASVPAHEIALSTLIENGPGDNRHVIITKFQPGGYVSESRDGVWTDVWIAVFPAEPPLAVNQEIAAVLHSNRIHDEAAIRRALQGGRVTGICSVARGSSWGATLGPELAKSNPGCQLSSAWKIEELREPPGEAQVMQVLAGAGACFVVVLALAVFIFWRNGALQVAR